MVKRLGALLRSSKEVNGDESNTVVDPKPSICWQDSCSTRFLAMPMNSPPVGKMSRVGHGWMDGRYTQHWAAARKRGEHTC